MNYHEFQKDFEERHNKQKKFELYLGIVFIIGVIIFAYWYATSSNDTSGTGSFHYSEYDEVDEVYQDRQDEYAEYMEEREKQIELDRKIERIFNESN